MFEYTWIGTVSLVLLYVLVQLVRGQFDLLDAFAYLLPFKAMMIDVGLQFQMYYLPLLLLIMKELIFHRGKRLRFSIFFLLLVFYVVVSTVIISNFFVSHWEPNLDGGFLRERGRYLPMLFKIIFLNLGIVFIINSFVRSREKIFRLLKVYVNAVLLLVVLGIAQFVVFAVTGEDIYPLGVTKSGPQSAINDLFLKNLPFVRISSLGGEPKGLAATIVLTLAILVVGRKFNFSFVRHYYFWILLLLFDLFFTLSTGGYGLLVLLFVTLFLLNTFFLKISFIPNYRVIVLLFAILAVGLYFKKPIQNVIDARVIQRTNRLLTEDVDQSITRLLVKNPAVFLFGTGSGNVHNFAYKYIKDKELKRIMKGRIFVSRYGVVKWISENGILGLAFFLLFYLVLIGKYLIIKMHDKYFFIYLLVTLLVFYFARAGYVDAELFFVTGLCMSDISLKKLGNSLGQKS